MACARGAQRSDGRYETTVSERGHDRTHRSSENDGTVVSKQRPDDMTVGAKTLMTGTLPSTDTLAHLIPLIRTVNDSGDGDGTARTAVCNEAVLSSWKMVRKAGNNGFEACRHCAWCTELPIMRVAWD